MASHKKSILLFGVACVVLNAIPALTNPPVEPQRWNIPPDQRKCNNCYNYATNHPNGSFAQPGQASGMVPPGATFPYTCGGLLASAESDGLTFAGDTLDEAQMRCDASCCLVALVMSDMDFHWYRQDANGAWSHKRGGGRATTLDALNASIVDPSTANRDYGTPGHNYNMFCGFMCVCRDDILPLEGRKTPKPIPADWYDPCPPNACRETPPNLNFPGCLPTGAPSLSPCVCCSCVVRILGIGVGECQ